MSWIFCTGNGEIALLDMPPQNDLRGGFFVLFGENRNGLFGKEPRASAAERIPRFEKDPVLPEIPSERASLTVRMAFHLVQNGLYRAISEQFFKIVLVEIGDAEEPHLARFHRLLRRTPRLVYPAEGLMQDEKVECVNAETGECCVDGLACQIFDAMRISSRAMPEFLTPLPTARSFM